MRRCGIGICPDYFLSYIVPPEVEPTPDVVSTPPVQSSTVLRVQSTSVSSVDSTQFSTVIMPTESPMRDQNMSVLQPVIVTDMASPNRIATGTNVTLICMTDRLSSLAVISWRYGFGNLPANAVIRKIDDRRSELNITSFDVFANTGPYHCTAEAGGRSNSTSVVLVPTGMLSTIGCSDSPAWQRSIE